MKFFLTFAAVVCVAAQAHGQDGPLTLDRLYAMPVAEAAAAALGPGPEAFVERSRTNGIRLRLNRTTDDLFGMRFYTQGEKIAPRVCAVTQGWATFDLAADARATTAAKDVARGQMPLQNKGIARDRLYYAAGPAPAVALKPDGQPEALSAAARAADSCANPVSGRVLFAAPSKALAISAVDNLTTAIAAAQGNKALPFALAVSRCDQDKPCQTDRRRLASINPQRIGAIRTLACMEPTQKITHCLQLRIDSPDDRFAFWRVTLGLGADETLRGIDLVDMLVITD